MDTSGPPIHFINVEYFLRLLYDLLHGTIGIAGGGGNVSTGLDFDAFLALFSHVWLFITILAYLFCLAAAWALIHYTLRYWQIKKEDEANYATVAEPAEHAAVEHSRWAYIMQLIESGQESDWRQSIIEADIMLDEMLSRQGYQGGTLADKLKMANPQRFQTLQQAWDAHKVRNDIAHQGSAYQLTNHMAYRAIANYEAVFREFNEI